MKNYIVNKTEDINHNGMKIKSNNKHFLGVIISERRNFNHGMNGSFIRYNLRCGDYLVVLKSSLRRIPFSYKECRSMVDIS